MELVAWLQERPDEDWASCALLEVELSRALRRVDPEALSAVPGVLARFFCIDVSPAVRATAASFPDPALRSLDAVQLACAQTLTGGAQDAVTAFVAYDKRLIESARRVGMPVVSPGDA